MEVLKCLACILALGEADEAVASVDARGRGQVLPLALFVFVGDGVRRLIGIEDLAADNLSEWFKQGL